MDDLKQIHGIGAATEKKLIKAGIDSFEKLAAATPDQLNAAQIAGSPEDWDGFVAAAAHMAKPLDLANATAEEVAAQATKIEATRLQLAQLADAVVLAHGHLQGLPANAASDLVAAADTALANARSLIDAAIIDARALFGVPDGAPLPRALREEMAPLENLPPIARQSAPIVEAAPANIHSDVVVEPTTVDGLLEWAAGPTLAFVSADGTFEEAASAAWDFVRPKLRGMGREKGYGGVWSHGFRQGWMAAERPSWSVEPTLEQTTFAPVATEPDQAQAFLADVIGQARSAAAAGELVEAGEYLRQHRTELRAGQVLLAEMLAGINAEIESLDLIQVTAPVEHGVAVVAKVDSRWRIGRQFGKVITEFEPGELGADELEALKADPLLMVTEVR